MVAGGGHQLAREHTVQLRLIHPTQSTTSVSRLRLRLPLGWLAANEDPVVTGRGGVRL